MAGVLAASNPKKDATTMGSRDSEALASWFEDSEKLNIITMIPANSRPKAMPRLIARVLLS
jgi:hypothetical protein